MQLHLFLHPEITADRFILPCLGTRADLLSQLFCGFDHVDDFRFPFMIGDDDAATRSVSDIGYPDIKAFSKNGVVAGRLQNVMVDAGFVHGVFVFYGY
jgi:hypothetical protein